MSAVTTRSVAAASEAAPPFGPKVGGVVRALAAPSHTARPHSEAAARPVGPATGMRVANSRSSPQEYPLPPEGSVPDSRPEGTPALRPSRLE
jgi:hypothetical protein